MKKLLLDLIAKKENGIKDIRSKLVKENDEAKRTEYAQLIDEMETELADYRSRLAECDDNEQRGFNPMGTYVQQTNNTPNANVDVRSTVEYHNQFTEYLRSGKVGDKLVKRENQVGVSADLGILLPETTEQAFLQALKEKYGSLYARVHKTNVVGGVKVPIGSFAASYVRITENGVSDRQKAGEIKGYVQFGYNIGELRLARTLLQVLLSPNTFDAEFGKLLADAFAYGADYEILNGDPAKNECEGILTEAAKADNGRLKGHIIDFTEAEIADWTAWEKKFFGILPVELENGAEFVMAKRTYVGNLCTLKDKNDQPINKAGFDVTDKQYKFNEVPVLRVAETLFKNFDACGNGEYFGMYWVADKAYAINENLKVSTVHYFDNETNQYVDKMIFINDGKILDPEYLYLLRKKVTA